MIKLIENNTNPSWKYVKINKTRKHRSRKPQKDGEIEKDSKDKAAPPSDLLHSNPQENISLLPYICTDPGHSPPWYC